MRAKILHKDVAILCLVHIRPRIVENSKDLFPYASGIPAVTVSPLWREKGIALSYSEAPFLPKSYASFMAISFLAISPFRPADACTAPSH